NSTSAPAPVNETQPSTPASEPAPVQPEPSVETQVTPETAETQDDAPEAVEVTEPVDVTASHAPVEAASIEVGKARYEKTCKVCHDAGLLEAPKITDKAEWQKRLNEKGLETLQAHSAKGFNKMPAQAIGDVTEPEVYAAVNYILEQAK
ncbi:c-type cytochrome, partial [Moraxella catarrhalis]